MKITLSLNDESAALYVSHRANGLVVASDEEFITAILLQDIQNAVNARIIQDASELAISEAPRVVDVTNSTEPKIDYKEILTVAAPQTLSDLDEAPADFKGL